MVSFIIRRLDSARRSNTGYCLTLSALYTSTKAVETRAAGYPPRLRDQLPGCQQACDGLQNQSAWPDDFFRGWPEIISSVSFFQSASICEASQKILLKPCAYSVPKRYILFVLILMNEGCKQKVHISPQIQCSKQSPQVAIVNLIWIKGHRRKYGLIVLKQATCRSEYVKHILKPLTTRTVISNALALHDSADHSAALSAESSSAAIDKTIELKTAAFPKAILKVTQGAAAFFNRFRQRCPNRTGQFYITRR